MVGGAGTVVVVVVVARVVKAMLMRSPSLHPASPTVSTARVNPTPKNRIAVPVPPGGCRVCGVQCRPHGAVRIGSVEWQRVGVSGRAPTYAVRRYPSQLGARSPAGGRCS